MEDYSILKDEYIYIKEKAFKDIRKVTQSRIVKSVKEYGDSRKPFKKKSVKNKLHNHNDYKKNTEPERQISCPIDKTPLTRISLQNIFIDYCELCYGIWLDFGELENLLQKELDRTNVFKKILNKKPKDNLKDFLLCPVCKLKLVKHKDFASNTISENCPVCGGIWLDSGEFAKIYLEKKHEESIDEILSGVIGKYIDIKA